MDALVNASGSVRFGLNLSGSFPAANVSVEPLIEAARRAERFGLEAVWVGDHIIWNVPILEPLVTLAAVAASTSKIRLGSSVLLVPLRNPVVLAKIASTLDVLSGGRLILGVGVGGESRKEFEACGVPVGQRGARTDESLTLLKLLWTTNGASFHGRFWTFENVTMDPKPLQKPHPPIWVGGRSHAALRRAARFGDGWIGIFTTPDRYRESLLRLEAFKREAGRSADSFTAAHNLFTYCASTYENARLAAAEYLSRNYNTSFDLFEKYCALGTPQHCAETIAKYVDAGARHIVLRITAAGDLLLDQLSIYLNEILPRFTK